MSIPTAITSARQPCCRLNKNLFTELTPDSIRFCEVILIQMSIGAPSSWSIISNWIEVHSSVSADCNTSLWAVNLPFRSLQNSADDDLNMQMTINLLCIVMRNSMNQLSAQIYPARVVVTYQTKLSWLGEIKMRLLGIFANCQRLYHEPCVNLYSLLDS